MTYQLSICISTYNRAEFIETALNSVLNQIASDVEIAICDNGSQDNTEEIIRPYLQKYSFITYVKLPQNIGPDRCFLRSVEIAQGAYCWFLCDDDRVEKGGLEEVLNKIKNYPDISGFSVNCQCYDYYLKEKISHSSIGNLQSDYFFEDIVSCEKQLFAYFGYLSGIICHRKRWLDTIHGLADLEKYFNFYAANYIIGNMLLKHPKWFYIHKKCVGWRSGNDSFIKELGRFKRFQIDVISYHQISHGLFGNSSLTNYLLNQVGSLHLPLHIQDIKFNYTIAGFSRQALILCLPRYWKTPGFWLKMLPLILLPVFLLRPLRFIYRIGKRLKQCI
ncbi:MAG: glycosyltransferase [Chlamydiae bacterium]|nr:glycosyltransferase [Chlamydiota bacterium]